MTNKTWMLVALAVVLGGASLYLNRGLFARDSIQIHHRSRPAGAPFSHREAADDAAINPLIFSFDRKVKLTSLTVVPVSDIETNKFPHSLWHLVSESNSVPIKIFTYGVNIQGMHPESKGLQPEPLEPGVKYRLFIQAGAFKAEHDFIPEPRS